MRQASNAASLAPTQTTTPSGGVPSAHSRRTYAASPPSCVQMHAQRLQGRTFLVRQSRLTPKHYPDGGVPSAHSRRTYAASPPSCVWMRAHSPRCDRRVHASIHTTALRSNLSCAAKPPKSVKICTFAAWLE